jgi:NADPH-dependent curcumin reductase CurA
MGPRLTTMLLQKNATMQGFVVAFNRHLYQQAYTDMTEWALEGKLQLEETVLEGFENIVPAFLGLFTGDNIGKMLVKVADSANITN